MLKRAIEDVLEKQSLGNKVSNKKNMKMPEQRQETFRLLLDKSNKKACKFWNVSR